MALIALNVSIFAIALALVNLSVMIWREGDRYFASVVAALAFLATLPAMLALLGAYG